MSWPSGPGGGSQRTGHKRQTPAHCFARPRGARAARAPSDSRAGLALRHCRPGMRSRMDAGGSEASTTTTPWWLLQRSNVVRSIVGAVTEERRSILRKCSLALVLAHEFQIAVEAEFGIAVNVLAAWSAPAIRFCSVPRTTMGLGHRSRRWNMRGFSANTIVLSNEPTNATVAMRTSD